MKKLSILLIGLIFVMASCSEDDASNNPRLGVTFNTVTTAQTNFRTAQANGLLFTTGTIYLKEVKFEYETENDSVEYEFDLDQTVVLDYATGATNPSINNISIPAGSYDEVEFELELGPMDNTPAIVVEGTFTHEGETFPVRFEFNYEDTFELSYEGNVTLNADVSAIAQIEINANAWFAAVTAAELAAADLDNDGVIVISKDANADLFDIASDGLEIATDVKIDF